MSLLSSRARRRGALALIPALGVAIGLSTVVPAGASSHREAPNILDDPQADNTDVYAFVSPDNPNMVTLIANFYPFQEPAGGPNFYPFGEDVLYRINLDTDGDSVDNIRYDFRFQTKIKNKDTFLYATGPITSLKDPDYNYSQTYSVTQMKNRVTTNLGSGFIVPPDNVGPVSTPNYEQLAQQGVYNLPGGAKVFAGQRDDPFYADTGSIFDLGQLRPFLPAYKPKPRAAQAGRDNLAGFNVKTIAIQVPINQLTNDGKGVSGPKDPDAVIGVYSTALRRQTSVMQSDGTSSHSGDFMQISRLGNPLVNEVIIPLRDKDRWNFSIPQNDAQFLEYVTNPEPAAIINALYGIPVPKAPRNDLVAIFLTGIPGLNQPANVRPSEMIRLNMGIPPTPMAKASPLGVLGGDLAGFPNGRRLIDDVVDIELRALAGGTPFTPQFNTSPNNDLGDGVNMNDKRFMRSFPYVATPFSGYDSPHAKVGSKFVPKLPDQK